MNSFKVLKANRQLIIFPILAGASLLMLLASFIVIILAGAGWDIDYIDRPDTIVGYLWLVVVGLSLCNGGLGQHAVLLVQACQFGLLAGQLRFGCGQLLFQQGALCAGASG